MKKAVLSPLCSAIVIPGLGQIINQDLKKGVALLSAVFLLFIIALLRLISIIMNKGSLYGVSIPDAILSADPTLFRVILAIFAVMWIYAVVDAFWFGRKMDRLNKEGNK